MYLGSFLKEGVFWKEAKPSYQIYITRKKKKGEKPLSKKQWEARILGKGSEDSDKSEDKLLQQRVEEVKESLPSDLRGYEDKVTPEDLKPKHREIIKDYHLDVVGEDAAQAVEIARKVERGIAESADVCKMSPPVCVGNKGIPRDKMPQIEGGMSVKDMLASKDPLDRKKGKAMVQAGADPEDSRTILEQLIASLEKDGTRTTETQISVGQLKATQQEIKASKTFGMADKHLRGEFDDIDGSIIVSRDGFILDGHHRWAALLTIDPRRKMKVKVIDMDMDDLLKEAASTPGVYKSSFSGDPLSEEEQKKYKSENKPKQRRKKKASRPKDLSLPERIEKTKKEFYLDLFNVLKKRLSDPPSISRIRDRVIWKWERGDITIEIEFDQDGNVDISFMTYIGGPGYFKRLLAPRISDVENWFDQGWGKMVNS